MPAIHFAAMAAKPGLEAELEQKLADFAKGIRELKCDGYGAIYAGPVNYNEERAKPFTHVLIVEFDNQDRIFKDYGSDSTPGGKFHAAANASFRPTYDSLLVADFEAPSFATGLVHVVCFTVAQGEEAQWTEGAGMIAAASKAGSGKLPVDVVYSGPLVGKWNKGLNHGGLPHSGPRGAGRGRADAWPARARKSSTPYSTAKRIWTSTDRRRSTKRP
ncbi:hypothetical protein DFJ74DRAFT_686631 [Hyaloraphidium curvatum]|nr:hypothetical protein DFJ74DRAFT_686631 [Hyaloraphidium curvatum]